MLKFLKSKKYLLLTVFIILIGIIVLLISGNSEAEKFKGKTYEDVIKEFLIDYEIINSKIESYYTLNNEYPINFIALVNFSKLDIKEPKLFNKEGLWMMKGSDNEKKLIFKINEKSIFNKLEILLKYDDYIELY